MSGLHGIAYTSVAVPMAGTELTALLEQARCFNAHIGVTGVLFHHAGRFFQYFEGEEVAAVSYTHLDVYKRQGSSASPRTASTG